MAKHSPVQQLDDAIQAILSQPDAPVTSVEASVTPLLTLAAELRDLPRDEFRLYLRNDLRRSVRMPATAERPVSVGQTITARLRLKNAAAAIEFYTKAFGAKELWRFEVEGHIPHAELSIGDSVITLADASPDHGYPGPEELGGSPVSITLRVDDVDAFIERAVKAGARVLLPVQDHFYGRREGTIADPFGYNWAVGTVKEQMSAEEMYRRFAAMRPASAAKPVAVSPVPKGFHTVTPYLVADNASALIDFVRTVFDGEETFRAIGPAGGIHAEVRVGDSMLMIGGGGPGLKWRSRPWATGLHTYVKDVDAVYERALQNGAESIQSPADQDYGERGASVKDRAGNHWYIATAFGPNYICAGLRNVNVYLHPLRAEAVMTFLKHAFGAEEAGKYASPDGVIHHARMRLGDSVIEMGEAHGPYQPMPTMFYLYVPDVDAMYHRALLAGGVSIGEPKDQPYGDRSGGIKDSFGNEWYIATHIKDV